MNSTSLPVSPAISAVAPKPVTKSARFFDPGKKPKRPSGGGGMVSTAADYLRFAQMMMHDGALGDTRLLSPPARSAS
jgi:CubicO group peptidase (beta-lactamase class C family)